MKLLTPSQRRDELAVEQARDIMRAKELKEILKDLNMKTAQAEANFQQMLAGQRSRWAKEEEEHTEHVKQLQEEIKVLEERKKRLSS